MKKCALIVAGGIGTRMNSELPKQFMLLNNMPILMHTITCFHHFDPEITIYIVLPETQFPLWDELCETHQFNLNHQVVKGGENRYHSVKNGLLAIGGEGLVAIHDGVRPLVSAATIDRCFETALLMGNAVPVMPVVESLRLVDGNINNPVDRSKFVNIQTPQVFKLSEIKQAYELGYDSSFTDDATVLERLGNKINIVEGNIENIKITTKKDVGLAKILFKKT